MVLLGMWEGWFGASGLQADGVPCETHAAHHEGPWLAVVFGAVGLFAVPVAIGVRFFGMPNSGASHVTRSQPARRACFPRSREPNTVSLSVATDRDGSPPARPHPRLRSLHRR